MSEKREQSLWLFQPKKQDQRGRAVLLLLFVYIGALVFAAIVAPLLYHLVVIWQKTFPNELNTYLVKKGVATFFERLRLIPIIVGLPWLMRSLGLWSWKTLGITLDKRGKQQFVRYFFLGVGIVLFVVLGQLLFTSVTLKKEGFFLQSLFFSLLSGTLLGLLEEIVFRGLLLRIFFKITANLWSAILLSSAFFAYIHYRIPNEAIQHLSFEPINRFCGFYLAFWNLIGISKNFTLIPFLNLFLLGVTLCLLLYHTRSLLPSIGLHAGAVTMMISYRKFFDVHEDPLRWLWGGTGLINGTSLLILLFLIFLFLYVSILFSEKKH